MFSVINLDTQEEYEELSPRKAMSKAISLSKKNFGAVIEDEETGHLVNIIYNKDGTITISHKIHSWNRDPKDTPISSLVDRTVVWDAPFGGGSDYMEYAKQHIYPLLDKHEKRIKLLERATKSLGYTVRQVTIGGF